MQRPAMPPLHIALHLPALLLILLLSQNCLAADEPETTETESSKPPKLFSSNETIKVTMTAPWRDLQKDKKFQGAYPAQLQYQDETGNTVTRDMTVERRGVKRQEACSFPPIRLRFEKEAVKGTTFRGQKSLKMVTHCEKSSRYDEFYILEMLAYRMNNLLTEYSFRVRPLEVTYVDSESGKSDDPRFAFLIEDDSDVAKRNDLKKVRVPKIYPSGLDPQQSALMSLFQYMIGNVDWAALMGPDPNECCHNVKLIGPEPLEEGDLVIPLPYDFDSSGLVNAKYAAPNEGLPIRSVTDRLYRGYCAHNEGLEAARQNILGQEAAIRMLVDDESRLGDRTKRTASKYLDKFFETARDDGRFNKKVVDKCRG